MPQREVGRGYSWPPFEPGNTVAVRHGAYSPRRVDPLAQEILAAVEGTVSWWTPADRAQAWRWARLEARCQLLVEHLADLGGDLDSEGNERPASALLTRLELQASNLASKLGLDPLSRARLGRDVAAAQVDVATLMAHLDDQDHDHG